VYEHSKLKWLSNCAKIMKKIVAVVGSPHLQGNTNAMVDYAFKVFEKNGIQTKKIALAKYKIKPCIACGLCKTGLTCSIKDDGMTELYDDFINADAVIWASPTYMGCVSAQIKALMDRTIPLRRNGFLLQDKPGAVFAVGGSRNGGQELVINQIQAFMHIHGMFPVGDDNHFGGIAHAPFQEDENGKETVLQTAKKIVRLLNKLK